MFLRTLTATALVVGAAAYAAPAFATPSEFTSQGLAVSYQDGKATNVPNTLYYDQGKIRLVMDTPVGANSSSAFSVVLAHEGGKTITLLNPTEKQAMMLDASSLESVTSNPSLQKISSFKLSEFGNTFRAHATNMGHDTVAGQPVTVLDHKGKDGHFRLWLSDKYDIPLRFEYFEGSKPAFSYVVQHLSLSVNLPASAFSVPSGYQVTDITQVMNGLQTQGNGQAPGMVDQ
ncbi:MAG TPA: hypothetical protein V6D47_13740 [Oscillatoriaceae cyanobacterium]